MTIEVKNAAPGPNDRGQIAEVVEKVKTELKSLGEDWKAKFDAFSTTLNQMQDELKQAKAKGEETRGEVQEKIDKFKTDLMTRIEDTIKTNTERMDLIETRMKQLPSEIENSDQKVLIESAKTFKILCMAKTGAKFDPDTIEPDLEGYKAYSAVFQKFLRRGEKILDPEQYKALSEGSDPDGGYFVRPEVSARIVQKIFESSPMRALATVETTQSGELDILIDNDEPDAGWATETSTRSTTGTPKISKKTIVAHEIYAAPKATQKLLEDASINVEDWLQGKVARKMARVEAAAFITGDGVGKPRGILTYAAGTAWGQIAQINTGVNGGFKYIDSVGGSKGLVNIMGSLKEPYHANATWLTNRAGFVNLLSVQDGDGRYIFAPQMIQGTRQAFIPTLLGYPIRMAADMPALATGSLSIAFGDFAEAYTIVDKLGITVQRDPYTKKPYVEFYTRKRVGGDVVNFEAIVLGKCSA